MKTSKLHQALSRLELRSWRSRAALFAVGVTIPLTAWSLSLSDYLNQSTVVSSNSQFEVDTSNNMDSVQIIPNAELIIVKSVINDDGGEGVLSDLLAQPRPIPRTRSMYRQVRTL